MGKKKTFMRPIEIIRELKNFGVDICEKSSVGSYRGRQIRVNASGGVDIGDADFDKWSNSHEVSFHPTKRRIRSQFIRACVDAGIDMESA